MFMNMKRDNYTNKVQKQGPIILIYLSQLTTFTLPDHTTINKLSTEVFCFNLICHIVVISLLLVFIIF